MKTEGRHLIMCSLCVAFKLCTIGKKRRPRCLLYSSLSLLSLFSLSCVEAGAGAALRVVAGVLLLLLLLLIQHTMTYPFS